MNSKTKDKIEYTYKNTLLACKGIENNRESINNINLQISKLRDTIDKIKLTLNIEEDVKINGADYDDRNINMTAYEEIIKEMMSYCFNLLMIDKLKQYADDNPFKTFNEAASMLGTTSEQALASFMVKHIGSIKNMLDKQNVKVINSINTDAEGYTYTLEEWKEKIGDNINYLLILWAMINSRV